MADIIPKDFDPYEGIKITHIPADFDPHGPALPHIPADFDPLGPAIKNAAGMGNAVNLAKAALPDSVKISMQNVDGAALVSPSGTPAVAASMGKAAAQIG